MVTLKAMLLQIEGWNEAIEIFNRKIEVTAQKMLKASGEADQLDDKLKSAGASAGIISKALDSLKNPSFIIDKVVEGMKIMDQFTNAATKLKYINSDLKTQAELQDKVFAAANRSRSAYSDMVDVIAKLKPITEKQFSSNDELIAFAELVQKGFRISGAGTEEQSSAMSQLINSMAAGGLQGGEFESIMKDAPVIADAIAEYTGKSKDELKKLSAEGLITADIIKNAIFYSADDINSRFDAMSSEAELIPMTFADVWNRVKNSALQAFSGVMESISKLINNKAFTSLLGMVTGALNVIVFPLDKILKAISYIGDVISYLWPIIEPILIAVGSALLFWTTTQIPLLTSKISLMVMELWSAVRPILAQAAAWAMANMPILLLGAMIGLLIYAILKYGDCVIEVVGVIGGVIGGIVAVLLNVGRTIVNILISLAEFIKNVFKNPVYSINRLFVNLAISILDLIQSIAKAIDKVFGTSLADGLQSFKNFLNNQLSIRVGPKPEDYTEEEKHNMLDIVDTVNFGYDIGKKAGTTSVQELSGQLRSLFSHDGSISIPHYDTFDGFETPVDPLTVANFDYNMDTISIPNYDPFDGLGTSMDPLTVEGVGPGGKVEVDMSDEDLKYLRDIAERDYINKFSTATLAPSISVSFGDVHETADADKLAGRIQKILAEEIAMAAEGVYA